MVRRRRYTASDSRSKNAQRHSGKRKKNPTLKEKFLTTAIWGLSIINIALIFSIISNFFTSTNESHVSANLNSINPVPQQQERVTVEVLNACGIQGLANEVTQYLRNNKFDVVNVGNYGGGFNLDNTLVLDRVSLSRKFALQVAEVLDIDENH